VAGIKKLQEKKGVWGSTRTEVEREGLGSAAREAFRRTANVGNEKEEKKEVQGKLSPVIKTAQIVDAAAVNGMESERREGLTLKRKKLMDAVMAGREMRGGG